MGSGASSNTMGLVRYEFMAAKVGFIDFSVFSNLQEIPRYPDKKDMFTEVKNINFRESLIAFVSHQWLRSAPNDPGFGKTPHPDNSSNDKFNLIVQGILQLKLDACPSLQSCYIWIDYSCLDQNKTPGKEIKQLKKVLQLSDCILTPIVDPIHNWQYKETARGVFYDYKANAWNKKENSYLCRGWCRLEMLYGANLPVTFTEQKGASFKGEFHSCLRSGRRPHYIFGTQDLEENRRPLLLGPHDDNFVEEFHPLKGKFTYPEDYIRVKEDMRTFRKKTMATQGYSGQTNYLGQKEGRGKMIYGNGDVYEGCWHANRKNDFGKYTARDGSIYEGEYKNGKKHGFGTFIGCQGDTYEGEYKFGKKCGQGKSVTVNGSVYEGRFSNDKRHGHGIFRLSGGGVYEGEYKNNKQHGYGIMRYSSGDIYEGSYKNGKKHGKGKYKSYDDGKLQDVYEGNYSGGQRHGFGKMNFANGDVYSGQYVNNKMSGKGKMIYSNKDVYIGRWWDGKRHGEGEMRYANGDSFKGIYKVENRHGKGVMAYADGTLYDGEYWDGKRHGTGKIQYKTGDRYDGGWKEGLRHGHGMYKKMSGEVYTGMYLLNKRHGQGKLIYPCGDVYEGEWAEGKRNGLGRYKYARDLSEYHGNWKMGKMHGRGKVMDRDGNVQAEGDWVDGSLLKNECVKDN